MKDIQNLQEIKLMVDTFYSKIREDEKLQDIFNDIIQDKWPEHLEKMYQFWQTVLLGEHTYHGNPFLPHAKMPINASHFEQWVKIFHQTINSLFQGEKAEQAKWQAERMAEMFLHKIEYYKNSSSIPLL